MVKKRVGEGRGSGQNRVGKGRGLKGVGEEGEGV